MYLANEACKFSSCSVSCTLADGTRCKVTNAVRLHLKLLKFTWDHELKILDGGPFPVILGLDFLTRTQTLIDVSSKRFSFRFHPDCSGDLNELLPKVWCARVNHPVLAPHSCAQEWGDLPYGSGLPQGEL